MGSPGDEAVDAPASTAAAAAALARLRAGETLGASELAELLTIDADRFGTGTLGLRWDRLSLAEVAGHLDVDERHRQPYGIVHGGVWCAVVESLASVAAALQVAGSGRVVVGVSNSTDFLRSHRQGRVEAVATPVHVGRSQQVWQVWLTRHDDGRAIARGQVRLANIEPATVGADPEGTAR
ncbi:MAG: PaaI family thioesterase [Nitriliruptoraceae bacterium]